MKRGSRPGIKLIVSEELSSKQRDERVIMGGWILRRVPLLFDLFLLFNFWRLALRFGGTLKQIERNAELREIFIELFLILSLDLSLTSCHLIFSVRCSSKSQIFHNLTFFQTS